MSALKKLENDESNLSLVIAWVKDDGTREAENLAELAAADLLSLRAALEGAEAIIAVSANPDGHYYMSEAEAWMEKYGGLK